MEYKNVDQKKIEIQTLEELLKGIYADLATAEIEERTMSAIVAMEKEDRTSLLELGKSQKRIKVLKQQMAFTNEVS